VSNRALWELRLVGALFTHPLEPMFFSALETYRDLLIRLYQLIHTVGVSSGSSRVDSWWVISISVFNQTGRGPSLTFVKCFTPDTDSQMQAQVEIPGRKNLKERDLK
jgi:hypothetical protein